MEALLKLDGLWSCVRGQTPTTSSDDAGDARREEKALSKIILSLDKSTYPHVMSSKTAREAWTALEKAFENKDLNRRLGLLKNLCSIKVVNFNNMEAYVNEIMGLAQQLTSIGKPLDDEFLGVIMMQGLTEDYESMVMALKNSGTQITSDFIKTKLLQDKKCQNGKLKQTGICRWLFLLISLSTWTRLIDSKEMRVVCYYTNWSVYRPGQAKFSPQNINPYLCTHLVYAFGGFTKENTLKPFDKYQDIEKGGYAKFIGLKTYNKNLKTMIAIGGWNEGSSRFSPMVASSERRKELVKNSIKFMRQNHFDGLDLDWEYPTFRDGGKPRDRDNYAQLVKELREEFERESEKTGRPRLLLTMAVPAGIEYINKGYDVPKLTKYLDWMNILSYDYHSAFEPAVNHHAPLYSLEEDNEYNYDAELNIDYTIKHYLKLGADPSKLVLGIPTYGRSYTLFNPDAYEIGAPADGPGDMGDATRENGYLAYYEICEYIKDQDWEVDEPNPKAMGPIAFKDNQWVGYDDENIVKRKAEYVAENSLGGIMFWAIDNDDFRGNCHGRPYPLIEAAKEALLNAYGLTEENLISPPSKPTKSSKQKARNRTRKTTTTTTEIPEKISISTTSSSRRRRIKSKSKNEDRSLSSPVQKKRKETNRKAESSTYSSLKVITPAYTTPAPPATPDMGGAFKCEDEGFYSHPKDCKKYFWCLGGPGETGIVAHQFTCPAGLYFNKAADSCDYSQNVLCNKKLQKATTSTEKLDSSTESSSSEKPTQSSIFSTSRVPPKITAATSKTSFRHTTTTEAYEDEDEYEYEDDEDEIKPEEDPKVIKELIDLIRKAGGIEELEKQLKFGKDPSSPTFTSDSTTPSTISKSLVERVLGKSRNSLNALKNTSTRVNSGGPQGSAVGEEQKEKKIERGRPQYKTLSRQRPSTEKSIEKQELIEEPVEEKQISAKKSFRSKSSLEYVNIRRPKTSSTTEANDDDEFNRNKILGEIDDEELDDEPGDEDSEEVTRKSSIPQYVNIKRTRPSTTEGTATSKYASIGRSTISSVDPEFDNSNEADEDTKYNIIRRRSTTQSSVISYTQTSRYQTIKRGTTTSATITDEDEKGAVRRKSTTGISSADDSKYSSLNRSTTTLDIEDNNSTLKYQTIRRGSTTPSEVSTSELPTTTQILKREEVSSTTENDLFVTTLLQEIPTDSTLATKNIVSSTHESTTESNNDVPSSSLETSSVVPTEVSEIATEKKRPVLFHPRPFSVGTESTLRPTTQSTPVTSKVSQSNLRFRLRQTTSPTTTTESSSTTIRSRGRSRLSNINRNLNEDRDQEEKYERTEEKKPIRNRKRLPVVTEKFIDYNEESDRKYRPAELADLSSLTAADLNLGGGEFISSHRRRRPAPSSSTTSTDKPSDEFEKSDPITLPLVKKLIDPSAIGKSRRIITKNEDQINASSDQSSTTRKIGSGFRSTTSRTVLEQTVPERNKTVSVDPVRNTRRKVFRRVKPTSSSTAATENALLEEASITPTTARTATLIRKRIPLYRVRQTKNETSTNGKITDIKEMTKESITTSENPLPKLFETKSRFEIAKNETVEDDDEDLSNEHIDVLNGEEGENIKLSESNIRESSQVNSFGFDEKPNWKLSKFNIAKSDIFVKSPVEKQQEETTEKQESRKTTTRAHIEISQTEPTRILRTRKIIRKLTTTGPPTTTEKSKRKYSILRLPHPLNENDFDANVTDKNSELSDKNYFAIRRTPIESATVIPEPASKEIVKEIKARRVRPSFGRRTTTEDNRIKNEKIGRKRNRFAFRPTASTESFSASTPPQNVYTTPTFSTTEYYENDNDNDNDEINDEDNDEEEEDDADDDDDEYDINKSNFNENADEIIDDMPRYTIYKTSSVKRTHNYESNINFDDENEEDMNNGLTANKSVNSFVLTTAENSRNQSETLMNKEEELTTEKDTESKILETNKNDNGVKTEISTKRNTLLHSQKDRPAFTRQRLALSKEEVRTKSQKEVSKTKPGYRTRSTTVPSTTITTATSAPITINEVREATESDLSQSPETDTRANVVEITTQEFSGGANDNESTTVELPETTQENDKTEESLILTTEDLLESTLKQITEEPIETTQLTEMDTTLYLESKDVTSTIELTTSIPLLDEILNSNQSLATESVSSNFTETTTEYRKRSTLRSVQERPKLGFSRKTAPVSSYSTTANPRIEVSSRKSYTRSNLFSKNRKATIVEKVTANKPSTISQTDRATTPLSVNGLIYKYSTTVGSTIKPDDLTDEGDTDLEDNEGGINEENNEHKDDKETEKTVDNSKSFRIGNKPVETRTFKNSLSKPKFSKASSQATSTTEHLGVDTEAIKNRNKNLFSKRKMNTPYKSPSLTNSVVADEDSSTSEIPSSIDTLQSTSTPSSGQTDSTDPSLTTLHHVFADIEETDTTTESMGSISSTNPGKFERLIEVNRIVEVKTKQAKVNNYSGAFEVATKVEIIPTVDKIGEISRITFIKIVDGNNETIIKDPDSNEIGTTIENSSPSPIYFHEETKAPLEIAKVEEIPASEVMQNVNLKNIELNIKMEPSQREERKFEIFGESKVSDSKVLNSISGKPEIIDGISHINIVTPKQLVLETSTISLQGLFQTEKPHLNPGFTTNDEVLETGPSEFVNVRVLDQDRSVRLDKGLVGNTNYIPVMVLPQDEDVTMKAHVVEIKPHHNARTIRIVPIRVEMSRSIANINLSPNKSGVKT